VLALGYGRKRMLRKKRRNVNCVKGRLTETRLKWLKKQKRWSKVREIKSFDEDIKEDRSTRKADRGQLNKWKNPLVYALENLAGKEGKTGWRSPENVGQVDLGFWYLGFWTPRLQPKAISELL
jgi:hypothetical protein